MYRKLLPYLRPYWGRILGSSLCSVVEAVFELTIPLILAAMLDRGIGTGNIALTLKLGGLMLLLAVMVFLCGVGSVVLATRAGTGFSADLRQAQFQHIQRFSFRDMERFGSASLITRMTSDVNAVQTAVFQCVKQVVRASSMVLVAAIMSVRLSARLSTMYVILIPALVVFLVVLVRSVRPFYRDLQNATDGMNLVTEENLIAIRTVKAFGQEFRQQRRFEAVSGRVFRAADRAYGRSAAGSPGVTAFTHIAMLILLGYGGLLVIRGEATIGVLTGFITYISQVFNQMFSLSNAILVLNRSLVSAQRINEVLDIVPEMQDGSETGLASGQITFRNVTFSYGSSEPVLRGISLDIPSGQTVGVVGGIGSAKSTLVQLIPRLYDVTEGSVEVDGRDVRRYSMETLRQQVAIVLQESMLFSGTIRENLQWSDPDADEDTLVEACKLAGAWDFISVFPDALDTVLGQGGINLSGGQRQRLCIARALVGHPRILILDDSTSAVDTGTEAKIRRALTDGLPDTTKIIISQRIRSVREASQILVLDQGRISDIGTHAELFARNEIYHQMCLSQKEGVA